MRIMRYFLSELCYNFLSITCGLQGLLVRDPGVSLPPFPLPPRAPTGGGGGGGDIGSLSSFYLLIILQACTWLV